MNYYQKRVAAQDPNTPTKTLEQLATDENRSIRGDVALNPNTPIKTLELLATDEDYWIKKGVAENPITPKEILQQLATDEDYWIRYEVAKHPNRNELIERLVLMTDHQQKIEYWKQ